MTKERLLEWGLTEEQAGKVMEGLNGAFVTKSRFNEVNTELTQAKATIKERDTQLEELQKAGGDNQTLKDQITKLQADNQAAAKTHEAELKALRIDAAVTAALTGAKAKNARAVKALLDLEKAELDADGTVKGLADQIKALQGAADSKFLFDTGKTTLKGAAPGQSGRDETDTGADTSKMSYEELCTYLEANPEAKLT